MYDAWSHERNCRCIVKTLVPSASRTARTRLLREGLMLVPAPTIWCAATRCTPHPFPRSSWRR